MLLGLAALFVALLLRAPLSETFAQSSPLQPEKLLAGQPPCATFSERGIDFAFLGYLPQADETTMLAWRITNSGGRALDAGRAGRAQGVPRCAGRLHCALGAAQLLARTVPVEPRVAWLSDTQRLAFLSPKAGAIALEFSNEGQLEPRALTSGRFWRLVAATIVF